MAVTKKNYKNLPAASDSGSFHDFKKSKEPIKLRDPYILFDFQETKNKYQIGYLIVYPGCRTGGHIHDDAEEVYHVINGYGRMVIGEDEFDIEPADTFIVPSHKMHFTFNTGNSPLKMFWAVVKT